MKNTLCSALALVSFVALLPAQEVVIKDSEPFTYAFLEGKGSYAQIPVKVNEFMGLFFKQGLTPAGSFFGMYLNSPADVKEEELIWRLGFPVAADAAVAAPLRKGEFAFTKVAVCLHVGPYEKVSELYGKMFEFFGKSGYKAAGPCIERYLDMNPQAVKPEDLRTEVVWPVEKK